MKKRTVSVILPSYNERDNLLSLIPKIHEAFARMPAYTAEILVVDDNSPDGTAKALRRAFKGAVRYIVRTDARGLATAIYDGVCKSTGEIIIGMDADGNHDPNIIPAMLAALEAHDFVVASRFVPGGGMEDAGRYVSSKMFNFLLHKGLGFPVTDATSGYYAVHRHTLHSLPLQTIYRGYGEYHMRLVWHAYKCGARVVEIPVYYQRRQYGQSKSKLPIMLGIYSRTALTLRFFHS